MNKHFEDAWYYLTRAAEHATLGLEEQLEPVATKLRALTGREPEPEPEPDRLETLRADARALRERVTESVRETVTDGRRTLEAYRPRT